MLIIRENKLIAGILGGLVAVIALVLIFSGGSDSPIVPATDILDRTPTAGTASTPSAPVVDRPDVAPLNCARFITVEEGGDALGVWDRPAGQQNSIRFTRGETCTDTLDADDRVFVRIEPGDPRDFEAATQLLSVRGEPVADVGEAARWFGGNAADGGGDQGLLSVRQPASVGIVHFRIVLGRPDLEGAEQLEVARQVALDALARFPGVVIKPPPPEPMDGVLAAALDETVDLDRAAVSFVDNLLVREEAGEWTRAEGLVATLKVLAEETEASTVLRTPDLLRTEGTGILRIAADYLERDDADAAAADEITRLLDLITYTNEELEEMAGISTDESRATSTQLITLQATQPVELCGNFFHGAVGAGVGTCLEWRPANVPGDLAEDKYRVFIPAPSLPQGGWTEQHFDLALGAMEFSARWFEDHGQMPPVNLVFSVSPGSPAFAHAFSRFNRPCGVILYRSLQGESAGDFQQIVAHELAHCFQTETFPDQDFYTITKWREEGAAEYLSNRVYPQNNVEWEMFGANQALKAGTSVFDLSYANGLFFQYLEQEIGLNGIFALIMSMPTSGGRSEQEANLASYPGMKELYQRYAEAMIDGEIADTGGGNVDFKLTYPKITVTGPDQATASFKPFGVARIGIAVNDCKRAHFDVKWDPAEHSARPEASASWGSLPGVMPTGLGDAHDRVLVATAREETKVEIKVTDVEDDPVCDETSAPPPFPEPCDLPCPPSEYYWRAFGVAPQ